MMRSASSTPSSPAESLPEPDRRDPAAARAVYVHVPFCARRCPYCDFAISPLRERFPFDRFVDALDAEASRLGFRPHPRTVYVGGGTPSALDAPVLERFLRVLATRLSLDRVVEFTVEANPEDVDATRARLLADAGVTRVSLGAQSFDRNLLRTLGRAHDAYDVARSVATLRAAGIAAVNVDMIFAVPGQDLALLRRDVDACLALEPDHVSLYGLTFEPGTSFSRAKDTGRLRATDSDAELVLYREAIDRLGAEGIEQYEVSNLARAAHRSLHNLVYWKNEPYLGLGPSAVSYAFGVRSRNAAHVRDWSERVLDGRSFVIESESLDPPRSLRETLMLGLRLRRGVRFARLRRRFGTLVDEIDFAPIAEFESRGLVIRDDGRIRLSADGIALADSIAAQLL